MATIVSGLLRNVLASFLCETKHSAHPIGIEAFRSFTLILSAPGSWNVTCTFAL